MNKTIQDEIAEVKKDIDKKIDEYNELNREGEWEEECARLLGEIDLINDTLSELYGGIQ